MYLSNESYLLGGLGLGRLLGGLSLDSLLGNLGLSRGSLLGDNRLLGGDLRCEINSWKLVETNLLGRNLLGDDLLHGGGLLGRNLSDLSLSDHIDRC